MWESIQLNAHRFFRNFGDILADYWGVALPMVVLSAVVGAFVVRSRMMRALARSLKKGVWVEDEHDFIVLIESARADPGFRQEVMGILRLEPFQRRSLLNDFIASMQIKGAPKDFVQAVALLKDPHVAEKALILLDEI